MKLHLSLSISLLFFSIQFTHAQSSSRFDVRRFISDKGDTLNYRILSSDYDTMRKYPLVVFLHGSGERGNDNEAQLKWGVMNFATDAMMAAHPAIVIAPQCPANMQWWSAQENRSKRDLKTNAAPSKPMELTLALIHQLVKTMRIDTNRIYITGVSMGGYGSFDAMLREPNLFAAAVPVCGAGDTSKAKNIAHIPMWLFHGAEDPAVDAMYSSDMVMALQKAGAHPGFTLYPATGHFAWLAAYSDQLMYEWLFSQHK